MLPMVENRGPQGGKWETLIVSLIGVAVVGALWVWFLYLASDR